MSLTSLRLNEVIEFNSKTPDARKERVLHIDPERGLVLLIEVVQPTAQERWVPFSEIVQALAAKTAGRTEDPYLHLKLPDEFYSEARLRERDHRVKAMAVLINAPPEIRFDARRRGKLMDEICDPNRTGAPRLDRGTAYKLWKRYLQRGQIENAFLGDHDKAGWTTDQREACEEARQGQPPSDKLGRNRAGETVAEKRAGVVLTRELKEIMYDIAVLYHEQPVDGVHLTWSEACDLGRQNFFNRGVTIDNGAAIYDMPPATEMPSNTQIKRNYYLRKTYGQTVEVRHNEKEFNLNFRPLNEDSRQIAYGAMEVLQVDFWDIPIYLVHPVTRKVMARPTGAKIRDTMSRMICSSVATWEHESAAAALLCIENLVVDKVEYYKTLGIEIEPEWAPCHHMGDVLLTDNGAFITKWADKLRRGIKLELMDVATCRGDMKPIVESGWDDLYEKVIKRLPGALPPDAGDRNVDPTAQRAWERAAIDIHQLKRLIGYYDLAYNRFRYIEDYPLSDDMKGKVRPIPLELWNFSLHYRNGEPRNDVTVDVVRLNCLKHEEATVTRSGIMLGDEFSYQSERCQREKWQAKAAELGHGWHIKVLVDIRNTSCIYYVPPNVERLIAQGRPFLEPCWRTRVSGERTDLELAEMVHEHDRKNIEHNRAKGNEPQQKAWLEGHVAAIVEEATEATKKALGGGRQRKGDLREERRQAKQDERRDIHGTQPSYAQVAPDSSHDDDPLPRMSNRDREKLLKMVERKR